MTASFAPSLAVIGLFLAAGPFVQTTARWPRALVAMLVLILIARYVVWRISTTLLPLDLTSMPDLWILACFAIEMLLVVDTAIFFLTLSRVVDRSGAADRHERGLRSRPPALLPHVDVFIPTYNEGLDVLERTIVGALGLDYPNFTVCVLDDGKRDWLRDFCQVKGARYIRREKNEHAKAGNVNHAISVTEGTFIAIFDADFVPYRDFIYRTVGFFDDAAIGCVQTPQHFFNKDPVQLNLGLDGVWPDEQRLFFDSIMPSRDAWGAAFCCGSCMIVRRSAMIEIGGIPTKSVTEDILTSLMLLRRGFKTIYLNERLSSGLAPESIGAYFVQRQRWCRGAIQTLFLQGGPLGPGLGPLHRLLFFPLYWMLQPAQIILLAIPLVYLWSGAPPLRLAHADEIFFYQTPALLACLFALSWFSRGSWLPLLSTASCIFTAIRLTPTVLHSCIRPFGTPFKVTPKGQLGGQMVLDRDTALIAAVLMVLTVGGIIVNLTFEYRVVGEEFPLTLATFWCLFNIAVLFLVLLLSVERPRRRTQERFVLGEKTICMVVDQPFACEVENLSATGAKLGMVGSLQLQQGVSVSIDIPDVGTLPAQVVWTANEGAGVRFDPLPAVERQALDALIDQLSRSIPDRSNRSQRVELGIKTESRADSVTADCVIENASLTGALLRFSGVRPARGTVLTVDISKVGSIRGTVVRGIGDDAIGFRFDNASGATRDRLIRRLYTEPVARAAEVAVNPSAVVRAIASRAFGRSRA